MNTRGEKGRFFLEKAEGKPAEKELYFGRQERDDGKGTIQDDEKASWTSLRGETSSWRSGETKEEELRDRATTCNLESRRKDSV